MESCRPFIYGAPIYEDYLADQPAEHHVRHSVQIPLGNIFWRTGRSPAYLVITEISHQRVV